jgi:hypothetical protein
MINIVLTPLHPVTIVAADQRRYYFARMIAAPGRLILVELRTKTPVPLLPVTHLIIEMFGLLGVVRAGTVSIEIACRHVSPSGTRLLRLQPIDYAALKIRIRHFRKQ